MWLGFAIAPLLPSVLFLLVFNFSDLRQAAFLLFFSISFSYLPCLLFGVPLVVFLRNRDLLSIAMMFLCGSLLGVVMFCVFGFFFSMLLGSFKDVIPELREVVVGGACWVLWWPYCLA